MPRIDEKRLQELADKTICARTNQLNDYILQTIGRRIKAIGKASAYDQQVLKNMADISGDMRKIERELARITKLNIADVQEILAQTVTEGVNSYKPLFDLKGIQFVPFEQNEYAQFFVKHWTKQTAEKMINLSRTKALCFDKYNLSGEVIGSTPLEGAFQDAIDDAVIAVSSGTADFNTAMRKTIENLGGSGVKVTYGGGVNRSLSGMVRQNLLYAAKQSCQAYDRYIGEKLGCDGFEVDYHSHPRPSHEFMGGKMYSYGEAVTIDGVHYEGGADALSALEDYGCLHFKTDVILGVSEPRYNAQWLAEQKVQDKKLIEYNGVKKTKYEWQQRARRIEAETRRQRDIAYMGKASGNELVKNRAKEKMSAYRAAYDDLCDNVGLEKRYNRMATFPSKVLADNGKGRLAKPTEPKPGVRDVHSVGKIEIEKYQKAAEKSIITDDVIITADRIKHIIDRRGQKFYAEYKEYFPEILSNPDYIFKDKGVNTAIASKSFQHKGETVNLIVRLIVEGENPKYKNSIITAIKENEKRFSQRLRNNKHLYKRFDNNE